LVDNSHLFGLIVARLARHIGRMASNVLPFAMRPPADLAPRVAAARLVVIARTARLSLTIAPRRHRA